MSRLYAWIISDMRQTPLTTRANQTLTLKVNYGSKDNSKEVLFITVSFPKDSEKPEITIRRYDQ